MMTYLISYELSKSYQRKLILSQAIMSLGESWARPLENTWYIRSKDREHIIKEKLGKYIDSDDAFLIQNVDDEVTMVNTSLRWFKAKKSDFEIFETRRFIETQSTSTFYTY